GKCSELLAAFSSSAGGFFRPAMRPVTRIFHVPIEGPTRRRVRAPGLQVPNERSCRPGALTRGSGREISGVATLSLLLLVTAANGQEGVKVSGGFKFGPGGYYPPPHEKQLK